MESLFYYGSDEENDEAQENDEEHKDELDANYDHVTMDMSDEDTSSQPPAHPADIGGESSGFSSSESCSSGENHSVPSGDKSTVKQIQNEASDRTKRDVPCNDQYVRDTTMREKIYYRRSIRSDSPKPKEKSSSHHYLSQETNRLHKKIDRHRSRSKERSHYRDRSRSHSPSSRHYNSKYRSSRSHHSTSRERDGKGRHRSRSREKSCHDKSETKYSVTKCTESVLQMTPQLALQKSMEEEVTRVKSATGISLPSYYNPIAINPSKYAEQMQKRKLLWGGGGQKQGGRSLVSGAESGASTRAGTASLWQDTRFSQDLDGKLTAKFKRLMGIKENAPTGNVGSGTGSGGGGGGSSSGSSSGGGGNSSDLIKKQEEMFNSMEMQYEVARVSTHTHRGLGLGFGVHQYPR